MSEKFYPIVPFDPYPRAAAAAIAKVEDKLSRGKRVPEYPYAKAFFKVLGTKVCGDAIREHVNSLYVQRERGAPSISEYVSALNRLIETRGNRLLSPLNQWVVVKLFPAVQHRAEDRVSSHISLRIEAKSKAENKQKMQERAEQKASAELARAECQGLSLTALGDWVSRWEERAEPADLHGILQGWYFNHNPVDQYRLSDTFGDASPAQIVAALQLQERLDNLGAGADEALSGRYRYEGEWEDFTHA